MERGLDAGKEDLKPDLFWCGFAIRATQIWDLKSLHKTNHIFYQVRKLLNQLRKYLKADGTGC